MQVVMWTTLRAPAFAFILRNIHSLLSHKYLCCSLPIAITEAHHFRRCFVPPSTGVYLDYKMIFCFLNLSFVNFIRDKDHFCYSVFDLELI